MRGYFVTGTDTGVGKTALSAALAIRLNAAYWKPIQTGPDSDTAEVQRLSGCDAMPPGIHLPDPVSPHLAAKLAGTVIDIRALVKPDLSTKTHVVEGAGGALVPINDTDLMAGLIQLLELPVIVAARSSLGTINHTLLTLEALRARRIVIAGVVMLGDQNAENRRAIEHYGRVPVLAEMPRFDPLTPEVLRAWAMGHFSELVL